METSHCVFHHSEKTLGSNVPQTNSESTPRLSPDATESQLPGHKVATAHCRLPVGVGVM